MRDASVARAGHHRIDDGFQSSRFVGTQDLERDFLSASFSREQQNFGTADGECQSTRRGALHEGAPPDRFHDVLPTSVPLLGASHLFVWTRRLGRAKTRLLPAVAAVTLFFIGLI